MEDSNRDIEFQEAHNGLIVEESDVQFVYTNAVTIGSSYFDFQLNFGKQIIDGSKRSVTVKDVSRIIMSPQHAKILVTLLKKQVDEYENKFGVMRPPGQGVMGRSEKKKDE